MSSNEIETNDVNGSLVSEEQTDSLDEQDVVKRKLQKLIALTIFLLFGLVATMYQDMAAS